MGAGQLEMPGMPRRLFPATPSKLATFADCPRRYRFAYVDRPTPAKGPAWAHNTGGAGGGAPPPPLGGPAGREADDGGGQAAAVRRLVAERFPRRRAVAAVACPRRGLAD